MMNIAALEYRITRLEKVKEMNQNGPELYKCDLMILKEKELLFGLTEKKEPQELISSMIHESLRW